MTLSDLMLSAAVLTSADGVPIHYTDQGKGDPALVFVHCWTCDRHLWDKQVPVFAKDHRVVTLDLPGHGESGKGRKQWSIPSFGQDVKAVADKLGLKKMVLIGSSMGGPVSLEAARLMKGRVVGIVPVDTLQNVDEQMPPEMIQSFLTGMRSDYKGTVTKFMNERLFAPSTPAAIREKLLARATSTPPDIGIAMIQANIDYDPRPALKELAVPVHAINSDLSPTDLEGLRKHHPRFDVVVMKGIGHYPMVEDPEGFNRNLAAALTALR